MSWNLSTGAKKALLSVNPSAASYLIGNTVSFGDGDGTGATDTINDSGNGLVTAGFGIHDFILIIGGDFNNVLVKAKTVAAGKIEVAAGTFTTVAAGDLICLVKITSGSFAQIFRNSVMVGRSGVRPAAGADATESGTLLVKYTKDTAAFVAGASANGLNFGEFSGTTLQRAIDPVTGIAEVQRGLGVADGTLGHVRWYANDMTTGASTSAIRMDGTVSTSGADVNIATGLTIVTDVASEITAVSITASGV